MAAGIPEPPAELLLDGQALWKSIWAAGATWISLTTDTDEVAEVCRLADDLAVARERYRATRDPSDARVVLATSERRSSLLAQIGFNPTARSRLGVAEVKRVSALDKLLERRQGS